MKLRIVNLNYVNDWTARGLKRNVRLRDKPWHVGGGYFFRTHAEAVAWADKKARKGAE